jgi:hypothetical protein
MVFLQSKSALCANYKEPGKQETSRWARAQPGLQPRAALYCPAHPAAMQIPNRKTQAQDWQGFDRSPVSGRVRQFCPETCTIPAKLIESTGRKRYI